MQKRVYIESVGSEITIARRKGTRSIRLSIRSDGEIRLSIPYGVSERQATRFLSDKSDWIKQHSKPRNLLTDGLHIGKSHRLKFTMNDTNEIKTRIKQNEVVITYPENMSLDNIYVQDKALSACERALKKETNNLLPQRLDYLSNKYGISYQSIAVKKLKSRWGSCDSRKNIILNIYLMQLDWSLIDYVILHELAHTLYPHHQSDFWTFLTTLSPNCKQLRKELKSHPTNVFGTNF